MTGRKSMITLEKMMMSQTILTPFRRLIQNPTGIIFVTGPTGSGKTTTLYSALHEINKVDLNISTIEDPIEIQLPGITGIEALKQLRADPATRAIPVIAVTASAMQQNRQEILSAGFDGYQPKPINIKVFLQAVREALDQRPNVSAQSR